MAHRAFSEDFPVDQGVPGVPGMDGLLGVAGMICLIDSY
jgi:hypothetical protein